MSRVVLLSPTHPFLNGRCTHLVPAQTEIGTFSQSCDNTYFWSTTDVSHLAACTNTIVVGGSSLTYTTRIQGTGPGEGLGPGYVDDLGSEIVSVAGTGVFNKASFPVTRLVESVTETYANAIFTGTAWNGYTCGFSQPTDRACYQLDIEVEYVKKWWNTPYW